MAHNKFSNQLCLSRTTRLFTLALAALIITTISACGSLKPKENTAYKEARVINALEIPPDLTRASSNTGNRIPAPDGQEVSAEDSDTFGEFKKYKEWEDFEAFRAWKAQNGDSDLTFEAYQQARIERNAAAVPTTPSGDVAVLSDDQNRKYLRVEDVEENVWDRLALSFENIGASILERDRKKGYYLVRYDEQGESTSLVSRLFSTTGERSLRVQLVNDESATNVLIQKKSGKPSSSDRARELLSNLATQLRTWASGQN